MAVFKAIGQLMLDYPFVMLVVLLVMNLISLVAYYADKQKAKKGKWRTPEATLIGLSFAFGSIGALVGMYVFRHKTKHIKFTLLVPLSFILQISFIVFSIVSTAL